MRLSIVIAAWLMFAAEARAQSTKPAEDAFERGRALMAKHSYAEACAAFELSQRLDPQYGTQFNLAGCYVALDRLATAWKLYRELARSDHNAERRARAAELAAALADHIPKLRVRSDRRTEGLQVMVDAMDATSLLDAEIPFDVGRYVIVATLPGFQRFRKEIDIEAGTDVQEVELVFEPQPIRTPETPSVQARGGKIALAGGIGLTAFGLFAGWRALANRDESRDRCNLASCPDRPGSQASANRARTWGNVSTITLVVGAIGTVGGIYLWRTSPPPSAIGAVIAPGHASLTLSGAF